MTRHKKILIIDDDMIALDIVDLLFEEHGFEVIRSSDGCRAISAIDDTAPDIVLVDLMMPKMSGQECIQALRAKGLNVPIVAFTAIDDPEVHADVETLGGSLVLTKPCKPSLLLKEVEALLDA
ncbi:response regulator [bacterium]|nr:response regulator [bacterium]